MLMLRFPFSCFAIHPLSFKPCYLTPHHLISHYPPVSPLPMSHYRSFSSTHLHVIICMLTNAIALPFVLIECFDFVDINECESSSPCGVSANCLNLPGNFVCKCEVDFTGELCDTRKPSTNLPVIK